MGGGTALAFTADVTDEAQVQRAVTAAVEKLGAIDVLHNHAGLLPANDASIFDIDEATIDEALSINVKGMILVGKHVARVMRGSGSGAIVNTASDLSYIALGGLTTYVTSKSAIPGLTRVMAADLADHGVRVNAVAPGFVYHRDDRRTAGPARSARTDAGDLPDQGSGAADRRRQLRCCSWPPTRRVSSPGAVLMVDGGHTVR